MIYIAIGVHAWGRGKTSRAALTQMRHHVSENNRQTYVVYSVQDENAHVNQYGSIVSKVEPVEIERKNWPPAKND